MKIRLMIERKYGFQTETQAIINDIFENLNIQLTSLRYIMIYDCFDFSNPLLDIAKTHVFAEANKDNLLPTLPKTKHQIVVEPLPGQFDQRADSAMQCVKLIEPASNVTITSAEGYFFDESLTNLELNSLKAYFINPVDSREKDLNVLQLPKMNTPKDIITYKHFNNFDTESLKQLYNNLNLAMNFEDFQFIQRYFQSEKRNPTDTEIQVLDTYWSDHCRHTTFETEITDVVFEKSPLTMVIENSFKDYLKTKHALNAKSLISLMDIATINAKYERQRGNLNDLELSEEVNAASIEIDVTVDNTVEKWYLMFKNETHNHPTEIEPFGGASTCIGGAIRDPLSGRSYVYAAMRITGAGDITMPIEDTLKGKLPQRVISKKAALGYASYGNQIGLPTTFVKELFHNGYVAKRMEIGAVLGAVKQTHLKRKSPQPGDVVLVLGGPTGRDGIGGATGSSKVHNQSSITEASSEVQKGNAPEERKLQRLFRHKKLSQKIKKANDFGAGGVSVAIGELAPGIKINLNKLPTKYFGMNGTELAISESQERMAVVIDKKDVRSFRYYCKKENIAVAYVADVTETPELTMVYNNKIICQLKRSFLDSSGIRQQQDVTITPYNMTQSLQPPFPGEELKAKLFSMLQHKNVASIQGLSELFDASIGRTTVLAPYGGKTMKTKTQASVHKIPVEHGNTSTVSIMAYGFDPDLAMIHPYLSSTYAVLESLAKVVATGGDYQRVRFTFQEYFERLNNDPVKWGKPLSALLGAYETLKQFGLAAVGGKDSMSGTYHDLDVPPTLVSFAVTTEDIKNIISPEFKAPNSHLYLFDFPKDSNQLPDFSVIKQNFNTLRKAQQQSHILSARAITFGGIAESLIKQSFGNQIGVNVSTVLPLFDKRYGAILVESNIPLASTHCHYLGRTTNDASLRINGVTLPIGTALTLNEKTFKSLYPLYAKDSRQVQSTEPTHYKKAMSYPKQLKKITVLLPIFPGTNCEYDSKHAFTHDNVFVKELVFNNQSETLIHQSIDDLVKWINKSHIIMLSGGFSSGDEPDGSGKFIASVLRHKKVTQAIHNFLAKKHLILGICNGFQALIKSGLLPYGRVTTLSDNSPTLYKNTIDRHVAKFVTTKVTSIASPWLQNLKLHAQHAIPISHTEGNFKLSDTFYKQLIKNDQVAFQYVDDNNNPTQDPRFNPNGSDYAIEGILSPNGLILGKMGHSERYHDGLFKNIHGQLKQDIFTAGIHYFLKGGQA